MPNIDKGAIEAACFGYSRSPEWSRVEAEDKKYQPDCVCCSKGEVPVQVHYIFPFHYYIALGQPDLELDDRNLITLCQQEVWNPAQDHHLLVGHLDSFQSSNLDVVKEAEDTFHGCTAVGFQKSPTWIRKVQDRLKPLDEMSTVEKVQFKNAMDTRFPPNS